MHTRPDRIRVLIVVNKTLGGGDYRLEYARRSQIASVTFAMPGHPAGIDPARIVAIPFGEGLSLADVKGVWRLYRHLRDRNAEYDIVHFFSTKLQLIGPVLAHHFGLTSVVTVTGLGRAFNRSGMVHAGFRRVYLRMLRVAQEQSAQILFQNGGDRAVLESRLPTIGTKAVLVGSAVVAPVVATKDFATGPLRILVVGRLMRDKGIDRVLQVAEALHHEDVTFTIAGPSSHGERRLHQEVVRAAKQGSVTYVGESSAEELQRLYRDHHVLLFLSVGEGMARVMLEGAHAMLCPVASDIAANRDLIDGPQSGFLVKADATVDDVVPILRHLRDNRKQVASAAASFQRTVLDRFGIDRYVTAVDGVLAAHTKRPTELPVREVG